MSFFKKKTVEVRDGSFKNFSKELKRMCYSFSGCHGCPFFESDIRCYDFNDSDIAKYEKTIKEWSLAHPKEPPKHAKTRAEDFLEKHPKAMTDMTGHGEVIPGVCAQLCGYLKEPCNGLTSCFECWNEPLEEEEEADV